MREDEEVKLLEKGIKKIHYLPEFEEMVQSKWNAEIDPRIKLDIKNIETGFLLIGEDFLKKGNGSIQQLKGFVYDKKLGIRGLLNGFSDVKSDYDYLFFWVENGNNHTLDEIVASIYVPPLFLIPPEDGYYYKCRYTIDNCSIRIICDKLLSWEKPIQKDRAYALIPLKKKKVSDKYDKEEYTPIVKVSYKDTPIKKIKGGEVTSEHSKDSSISILD